MGDFGFLVYRVVQEGRHVFHDRKRLVTQLDTLGVNSLPLVLIVGFFAGGIIAWQAAAQFRGMISLDVMGGQSMRVVVMEMGPVLTALVISGRLGASMTAEIGSMKITEQVDALKVMGIDPIRFLVLPRVLALALMMPLLTLFADMMALIGSFVVSDYFLDISRQTFFDSVKSFFHLGDLLGGLFKSLIFGLLIAFVGCLMGLQAEGGASGVGKSTIKSFVICAICVLVSDFCLWLILF